MNMQCVPVSKTRMGALPGLAHRAMFLLSIAVLLLMPSATCAWRLETRYIAPDYGSTDVTTCGFTRHIPCNGIVTIIDGGCKASLTNSTHFELRLLPGRFVMPIFGGPKLLAACNNFSVLADSGEQDVTVVVNPFEILSPVNETYQPNLNKVGNHNGDVCGLKDAANFFGSAAFAFLNSTEVLLQNLIFEMASSYIDLFITINNVGRFIVDKCKFLKLPTLRQAIGILNPIGQVTIQNCTFEKLDHASTPDNEYESSFNNLQIQAAVYVFQTIPAPSAGGVLIVENNFTIVRSKTPLPWTYDSWETYISRTQLKSLCRTTGHATLLRIRLDAYAANLQVYVTDNTFAALGPRYAAQSIGSAMAIAVKCNAKDNTVAIFGNSFLNHVGQQGSGLQISISGLVRGNSVILFQATFQSNGLQNWTQEGGALRIFATDYQLETNEVIVDTITLKNNSALFGSAIHIERRYEDYEGCPVCINPDTGYQFCSHFPTSTYYPDPETFPRRAYIMANLTVDGCEADRGALHAKHVMLYLTGTSLFSNNLGGAMYLSDSVVNFAGNITFLRNIAQDGGAIALYDGSQIAVNTSSHFFFNPKYNVLFRRNYAFNKGGAIYVGQKSSTINYNSVVENGLSQLRFTSSCFIQTPALYLAEDCSNKSMPFFYFDHNGACIQGQDIFTFSLLLCRDYAILPGDMLGCPLAATVMGGAGTGTTQRPLTGYNRNESLTMAGGVSGTYAPAISTSSTYLWFRGTSCSCQKTIIDSQYILPDCHEDSINSFLRRSIHLNSTAQVLLDQLPQFRLARQVGSTLPDISRLLLPWSGTFVRDADANLFTSIALTDPDALVRIGPAGEHLIPNPSNIILMPAPGEEFHLNFSCVDQLQGDARTSAYISVERTKDTHFQAAVLLRQNGDFQLSSDDKIPFVPGQPLVGISLVGMPGTRGELRIYAPSLLIDKNIELRIPFQLAPCPHGYLNPTLYDPSLPENRSYETAVGLASSSSSGLVNREWLNGADPLACNCDQNSDVIASCSRGKEIYVKSSQWGGIVPSNEMPSEVKAKYKCNNTELDLNQTSLQDLNIICIPVPKSTYQLLSEVKEESSLLYGDCLRDTCQDADSAHKLKTTGIAHILYHSLEVSTPCSGDTEGLVCGRCRNGTALTPYYVYCQDCRGAKPYNVLITTCVLGIALFSAGIYFTWGMTPTLVSLLFFCQSIALVVHRSPYLPRGQEYITQTLTLDLSFGMCFDETFTALDRLLWAYFSPAYFLFLLLVSYLLSNIKVSMTVVLSEPYLTYELHFLTGRQDKTKQQELWQLCQRGRPS
eukprot:scpid10516/ scgid2659/ 